MAKKFRVAGLPDIRLLSPDGTEKKRLQDFQEPKGFAKELEELLKDVRKE